MFRGCLATKGPFVWAQIACLFFALTAEAQVPGTPSGAFFKKRAVIPQVVQHTSGFNTSLVTSFPLAFVSAVASGNLLVACTSVQSTRTITSVTDNKGNTWSQDVASSGGGAWGACWHAAN